MLEDMSDATLRVLDTRNDIACVLVNPLQALHPNRSASSDATLINSERSAAFDRNGYAEWLRNLRAVCTRRGIALIFDEVFVGFRLGRGGAQELFGVGADLVTYGKTVGGGLPIGVVCGKAALMKRYREDRPTDVCFARGTFNSHPYVMAAMNEFLQHANSTRFRDEIAQAERVWNERAAAIDERLETGGLPVRIRNLSSIWLLTYTVPSRYNWMLQYYLRAEGLALSWVGTGRFIFSHNYTDDDVAEVGDRLVRAATQMAADGWWWQTDELTDRRIKRRIAKELLAARFGRASAAPFSARAPQAPVHRDRVHDGHGSSDRPSPPSTDTAATSGRS